MLKRYLVFAGRDYDATGGMGDFINDYDTEPKALVRAKEYVKNNPRWRWSNVYDQQEKKEIWNSDT